MFTFFSYKYSSLYKLNEAVFDFLNYSAKNSINKVRKQALCKKHIIPHRDERPTQKKIMWGKKLKIIILEIYIYMHYI